MGLTIADSYYLKARSASCGMFSDWEEVCESLNYALSYDQSHCASWLLLGEIYAEQFQNYKAAFDCFDKVIAINPDNSKVYGIYATYLIWAEDIERAEKLVDFGKSVKASNKAHFEWLKAYINETKAKYKKALKYLKSAKKLCYNDHYFEFMQSEEKRIKKKMALAKSRSKSKLKSKSKKNKKKKK